MVGQGCPRLLQLPRSADQRSCTGRVPTSCHRSLAAHVTTSQSEASDDLDADDAARGYLASKTDYPPSLAERPLCRYTPEVGAVCGKAARTVLCGGRAVNARPYRYPPTPRVFRGARGWHWHYSILERYQRVAK